MENEGIRGIEAEGKGEGMDEGAEVVEGKRSW